MDNFDNKDKIGLVLEGGGARGSYEIGAYKAIKESGIEISGVAGTSIGAINAAMIVQDDLEKAYQLWYNISPSILFDIDEQRLIKLKEFEINKDNIFYIWEKAKYLLKNKGIELVKIRKLLSENINEDIVRSSQMDYGLVTINLSNMKPLELYIKDIPHGKLIDYIIASSYLPAFKMEKMDGKFFLDGGFYNNLPINLLANNGYKNIIAIRTHSIGRVKKVDANLDITFITPEEDLGNILDFTQGKMRYNLQMGYYDTLKVLQKFKGKRYYIKSASKEEDYLQFLLRLNEKQLEEIRKLLNLNPIDKTNRRTLIEIILKKLANLLETEKENYFEDIIMALLELAARNLDIERFKIYEYEEFLECICQGYLKKERQHYTKEIPGFIKYNDFLSRTIKEKIINDVLEILFCGNSS